MDNSIRDSLTPTRRQTNAFMNLCGDAICSKTQPMITLEPAPMLKCSRSQSPKLTSLILYAILQAKARSLTNLNIPHSRLRRNPRSLKISLGAEGFARKGCPALVARRCMTHATWLARATCALASCNSTSPIPKPNKPRRCNPGSHSFSSSVQSPKP